MSDAPETRAASMNGRSFRLRTWARITRATPGHPKIASVMMMIQMLGRRISTKMRTIGRKGRTRKMSVVRISRVSTSFP